MIRHLEDRGFTHLHHIHIQNAPILSHHRWLSTADLELSTDDEVSWNQYIQNLQKSMVSLSDKPNLLLWTKNSMGGTYLPKLGYLAIREQEDPPEPNWWCQSIWRIFCPLKIKLFSRLVLDGNISVWDSLTHSFLVGPDRCNLCERIPNP